MDTIPSPQLAAVSAASVSDTTRPSTDDSRSADLARNSHACAKTLVVGVGNSTRGDDGIGLWTAQEIRRWQRADITVVECAGDIAGLMDIWNPYDRVYIVDAIFSPPAGARLHRFDVTDAPLPQALFPHHSTHALGVGEAIELARALGRLPRQLIVFGIEVRHLPHGFEITDQTRRAALSVLELIRSELDDTHMGNMGKVAAEGTDRR